MTTPPGFDAARVVVDTDLVIDFLRGKGAGSRLVPGLVAERRFTVTAVTAFELRVGTDFMPRRDRIGRLLNQPTLPFDVASALEAGRIASALGAAGTPIGMADCMQAGMCIRYRMPFATRNRKHFDRIDGLDLVGLPEE